MPGDLFFRTEDIRPDEVLDYLVETDSDRQAIEFLKGRSPVILKGSRGVGKSFLFRVAEAEIRASGASVLPVYVTFARASLIRNPTPERFLSWMLARISARIVRAATDAGITLPSSSAVAQLTGAVLGDAEPKRTLEQIALEFEDSWRGDDDSMDANSTVVPAPETLIDAAEDLCRSSGLKRIVVFIDEAAHVFIPQQQRQFFTLMRDLRSPFITVKAAVYPGVTSFGDSFQPTHDATVISIDRSITDDGYLEAMVQLVLKQDPSLQRDLETRGQEFAALAFASTGNPRILLKTLSRSTPFKRTSVENTMRSYYREEIWAEHSSLAEKFPGHAQLIDWGRGFIEGSVLDRLRNRNEGEPSETSSYLWVHRDAPETVKEALRLLCYSGVLQEGVAGIKGTRSEPGTRYMVNLGCQTAMNSDPVTYVADVRRHLSVRRMVEYGANSEAFNPIDELDPAQFASEDNSALEARLGSESSRLDLTYFQHEKLLELGLRTIRDVLEANEETYMQAHYVGRVRSRQMRNAAVAAVLEYLSG